MHISFLEAQSEYQATRVGVLWIPLQTLIFVGLLAVVFHSPGGERTQVEFLLYVMSGYVCWNFIADSISGSTSIIQQKFDFAVHNGLSLAGLFAKALADRIFEYAMNLGLLLIMLVFLSPQSFGWNLLLFLPLVVLLCVSSLAVSYLVNLVTLFVPDLQNVIRSLVRLMMFATPVFWSSTSGARVILERYNPAAYFLKVSREVFGVDPMRPHIWAVTAAITLALCVLGFVAYRLTYKLVRNIR